MLFESVPGRFEEIYQVREQRAQERSGSARLGLRQQVACHRRGTQEGGNGRV